MKSNRQRKYPEANKFTYPMANTVLRDASDERTMGYQGRRKAPDRGKPYPPLRTVTAQTLVANSNRLHVRSQLARCDVAHH